MKTKATTNLFRVCLAHSDAAFVIVESHLHIVPHFDFPATPDEHPELATKLPDKALENDVKTVE